jgi:hypothetical protein
MPEDERITPGYSRRLLPGAGFRMSQVLQRANVLRGEVRGLSSSANGIDMAAVSR